MNIVWVEFNSHRSKILFQSSQLRCARDRNDPRLLRKQPAECDMGGRYLPSCCERTHQINRGLVALRFSGLNLGTLLRKSVLSNFMFASILPAKKPLPSGLNGTKPIVGTNLFFERHNILLADHSSATQRPGDKII
jgi:hypothetical protein